MNVFYTMRDRKIKIKKKKHQNGRGDRDTVTVGTPPSAQPWAEGRERDSAGRARCGLLALRHRKNLCS